MRARAVFDFFLLEAHELDGQDPALPGISLFSSPISPFGARQRLFILSMLLPIGERMAVNPAMLDKFGLALALLFGGLVLIFGQFSFFALFLVFLIASVAVTKYGYSKKREMGLYEHERSWENVLANGLVPTLAAILWPVIGWGPYVGSVAAIAADKFASELGVLGPEPRSLLTLKPVKRGISGAISMMGTLMSLDGALLIGLAAMFLMPSQIGAWKMLLVASIGFGGSFADSLFGVLEERGIGTKATTNILCSLVGALLGWALLT